MLQPKTGKEFLNDLWEDLAGIKFPIPPKIPTLQKLKETQWCPEFEKLMRNRLIMGAFRYGLVEKQDYSKYNLTNEAVIRIKLYENDRNLEHLVDAANILLLAFLHGKRLKEKFSTKDNGRHTPEI